MCVDPDWGLGLAVVVALYIYRNNRKLQAALTASQEAREALRLSEERHRFLADNVSDVIWTMDLHGRNTYVSPSVERMRGYTVAEAMQQTIDEALTPASAKIAQAGVARDISERKRTELNLQIAAIAFQSQDGVIVTDAHKAILRVNPAFSQISGYAPREVIGKTPRMLRSDRHTPDFYDALWTSIETTGMWHGELWSRRKNGEVFPEQITITPVKDGNAQVTHYVAVLRDITERKRLEQEVNHLAFFDSLTQLPNRRLFNDRLGQAVKRAQRTSSSLALMFVDLDKFKPVNDTYGHAAGDFMLQTVAKRLSGCLRSSDTAARVGGDEFLVLLPDIPSGADALAVAEKIRSALAEPCISPEGIELCISASIGIAIYPEHARSEHELLRLGDRAMYEAKSAGGNRVKLFSPEDGAGSSAA